MWSLDRFSTPAEFIEADPGQCDSDTTTRDDNFADATIEQLPYRPLIVKWYKAIQSPALTSVWSSIALLA